MRSSESKAADALFANFSLPLGGEREPTAGTQHGVRRKVPFQCVAPLDETAG